MIPATNGNEQLSVESSFPLPQSEHARESVRVLGSAELSIGVFLRSQAAQLIEWAISAELEEFLLRFATITDARGRPAIVRNGYQPARQLVTNLGSVQIRVPKVRSRTEQTAIFHSTLVRPYLRRTHTAISQAPAKFLRALSKGDLYCAIAALMGPDAAALPAAVMQCLNRRWAIEYEPWLSGSLARLTCASLRLESLNGSGHSIERSEPMMLAIGVDDTAQERMLAVAHGAPETLQCWTELLAGLRERGLPPPSTLRLGQNVSPAVAETVALIYPATAQARLDSPGARRAG